MIKLLLLVVLIGALAILIMRALTLITNKNNSDTVVCSKCGTYILKKEAILRRGKYFCSKECL